MVWVGWPGVPKFIGCSIGRMLTGNNVRGLQYMPTRAVDQLLQNWCKAKQENYVWKVKNLASSFQQIFLRRITPLPPLLPDPTGRWAQNRTARSVQDLDSKLHPCVWVLSAWEMRRKFGGQKIGGKNIIYNHVLYIYIYILVCRVPGSRPITHTSGPLHQHLALTHDTGFSFSIFCIKMPSLG